MPMVRVSNGGTSPTTYNSVSIGNNQYTTSINLKVGDVLAVSNPRSKLYYKKNDASSDTQDSVSNTPLTILTSGNFKCLCGHATYGMSFVCLAEGAYSFHNTIGGDSQYYCYPIH